MHLKLILTLGLIVLFFNPAYATASQDGFKVPFAYGLGKNLFAKNCSGCHGKWGKGTPNGPSLMHPVYVSSHHGDQAFYRAALNGVRSHHWKFGDMPPVPGIDRATLNKIVPYIRWLQQKNGIK
ncbi:MAG: cytochrome c [Proteobacteria bacterium]|nr:cytochrome c [Pseudomonadota bacterium]